MSAELRGVERAAARLARAATKVDAERAELEAAIRQASSAGATLRPLAQASGLSVEWVRQIIARAS